MSSISTSSDNLSTFSYLSILTYKFRFQDPIADQGHQEEYVLSSISSSSDNPFTFSYLSILTYKFRFQDPSEDREPRQHGRNSTSELFISIL